MHLQKLAIVNYKNIAQIELELSDKLNCFVGNNGEGKTNILDSIYYLSMCKSYFNNEEALNVNHEADFFIIEGNYLKETDAYKVFCAYKRHAKKKVKLNDKEYSKLTDHIGLFPIVVISPSDSSLITDGGEERRKYLNGVISQFDKKYLQSVLAYNRVLAQRNKALKDFAETTSFNDELLNIYDEQLVQAGHYIFEKRKEFLSELRPVFQKNYSFVSQGKEDVGLVYKSDLHEKPFLEILYDQRLKDKALQYTSKGVHKDDLVLNLGGYSIKKIGSQGQKKTYLIALKLAQFEFLKSVSGQNPILLLDDIFDKLDMNRVEQFIKLVADEKYGQIFITDTNYDRLKGILDKISDNYKIFNINRGTLIDGKK